MADFIIGDDNWDDFVRSSLHDSNLCGMIPRDYQRVPYGSMSHAPALGDAIEPIPMEEWPDRIADAERERSTLIDVWEYLDGIVLNQSQLSYCWAFSSVKGYSLTRSVMGLPFVHLSPSSVAAPVVGYKNSGWYIEDALKRMVEVGVATTTTVPALTTSKADFKPGWKEEAAKYRVAPAGWLDVPARDFKMHGTMLLSRHPVVVGLNYWGHAVLDLWLRDMNHALRPTDPNRYGIEFLNSWGVSWGNKGRGVRTGTKKLADSIYALSQSLVC